MQYTTNKLLFSLFLTMFTLQISAFDRAERPDAPNCKESGAIVGPNSSNFDQAFIAQKLRLIKKCLCGLNIDITAVFTVLEDLTLCDPIPLTQDDVINGAITLDIPGFNYCFAENITGTLIVTGNNIHLDLNERVLFGVVIIDANEVTIENGKIMPDTPTEFVFINPAITIGSENTLLQDLLIVCEDTHLTEMNGRSGIDNNGNKTRIINCTIKSGSALGSATGVEPNGGFGIRNTGNKLQVINCCIETGHGGNQLNGGTGGIGGDGIECLQEEEAIIKHCFIQTGSGGDGNNDLIGPRSGFAINTSNGSFVIEKCIIQTGIGGAGASVWGRAIGMSFAANTREVVVRDCSIETGSGGGSSLGTSGFGIRYIGTSTFKVYNTCVTTGPGIATVMDFGSGGVGIHANSHEYNELADLTIITGHGGVNGNGGIGMIIQGPSVIQDCSITTGSGVANGISGMGIFIQPFPFPLEELDINRCIVTIGAPGSTGGNGVGIAISFNSGLNKTNISDTSISNADTGFLIFSSNNICLKNCKVFECINDGFAIENVPACSISDCQSFSNMGNGFQLGSDTFNATIINSIATNNTLNGFLLTTTTFTITNCQAISNGVDGFNLTNNTFDGHVVSNQANNNGNIGINNASGDMARHQIYNNISSQNTVANYASVALVETVPTVDTGFYANVV